MSRNQYDLIKFLRFVQTQISVLIVIILATVSLFLGVTKLFVPVQYKSYSAISVPTRYFQQPVVEDILPAVNDQVEMKVVREGLVNAALGRPFLEKVREQFNLFEPENANPNQYEINIQKLAKQFEVISLGVTSFQVGYIGSDSKKTYEITKMAESAVVKYVADERSKKLLTLRDNLIAKIDSLGFNIDNVADPLSTSRPEILRGELQSIRSMVASLSQRYTIEHPLVKKYKEREKVIVKFLAKHSIPQKGSTAIAKDLKGISSSNIADVERYTALLRQVDRLNVLIDFEEKDTNGLVTVSQEAVQPLDPISPKYRLVFFWALLTSLLVCAVYLSVRSFSEVVASPTARLAAHLNLPYLGTIPDFRSEMAGNSHLNSEMKVVSESTKRPN